MRVDLPAPFSPSSACTSPERRSRSTRSLATRLPKRFVTPRSSRAGASGTSVRRSLLDRVGDVGELPRRDLLLDLLDLGDVLGALAVRLADPDAVVLDVEERVPRLEAPALHLLDRLQHGLVD